MRTFALGLVLVGLAWSTAEADWHGCRERKKGPEEVYQDIFLPQGVLENALNPRRARVDPAWADFELRRWIRMGRPGAAPPTEISKVPPKPLQRPALPPPANPKPGG